MSSRTRQVIFFLILANLFKLLLNLSIAIRKCLTSQIKHPILILVSYERLYPWFWDFNLRLSKIEFQKIYWLLQGYCVEGSCVGGNDSLGEESVLEKSELA